MTSLSSYRSVVELAQPIECRTAIVRTGVIPSVSNNLKAILIHEGEGILVGDFDPTPVRSGDLVVVAPSIRCGAVSVSPVDASVAFLNPAFVQDQLHWLDPQRPQHHRQSRTQDLVESRQPRALRPDPSALVEIETQLTRLLQVESQPDPVRERLVRGTELVCSVAALLDDRGQRDACEGTRSAKPTSIREEIQTVLAVMNEHYMSNLRVDALAQSVWMSESSLRRAFRTATGISPREYLHRLRLAHYESLVAETSIPLSEAARLAGWASPSHAREVFTRAHGVSPSRFRVDGDAGR